MMMMMMMMHWRCAVVLLLSLHVVCESLNMNGSSGAAGVAINIPDYEIQALQDLYDATNGPNWGWRGTVGKWDFSVNPNPCLDNWQGITCTNFTLSGSLNVEQIQLTAYLLIGTLPESIGNFSMLTILRLSSNYVNSTIPDTLHGLAKLQVLDFNSNDLTGTLPNSVRNLTALQQLSIELNELHGTIPSYLCELTQLQTLSLGSTSLSGPILDCLGNLPFLSSLDLSSTYLVGTIPESYGQLTQLYNLRLAGLQHLHGTIPNTFANLTNLNTLILDTNDLTGTIPELIGNYHNIFELSIVENAFTGTIPISVLQLTNMAFLYLQNNQLNGTIPAQLLSLPALQILLLSYNQFSGNLRGSCGAASILLKMDVGYNLLTGTLPTTLSTCTSIRSLLVNNNQLDGHGMDILHILPRATALYMSFNAFTGTIPQYISTRSTLQYLLINNNQFSGSVPYAVFDNKTLIALNLGCNKLDGTLPVTVTALQISKLGAFVCGGNQLTGPVPSWFSDFTITQTLNLTENHFTGTLPAFLTQLSLLSFLYASDNLLTGTLPQDWSGLPFLSFLYLDNNFFTNTLPESIGYLAQLQSLNLSSNYFSGSIPDAYAKLSQLQIVLLNNNKLRGSVQNAFNVSMQTQLATIQLSNNQLTGSLPEMLFRSNSLKVFAAVSNCFTGSIPLSICNSTSINTLALDGLQSATSCRRALFPASLDGIVATGLYTIDDPLSGGVPLCLFQMAKLSGNGLTGELPSDLIITPTLTDLSLSHNKLEGKVPSAVLNRDWTNLDLSYNRFTGDLQLSSVPHFHNNASFYLEKNRLSGYVPSALQEIDTVSVLEGNVFSCNTQRSDIPSQDPEYSKYQCGSNSLNDSLYALLGLLVLLLSVMWFVRKKSEYVARIRLWWSAAAVDTSALADVQACVRVIVQTTLIGSLYSAAVLLPLYAILTVYYGTYTEQYAWTVSVAFLTGRAPFALCFAFLLLLLVIMWVSWLVLSQRSKGLATLTKNQSLPTEEVAAFQQDVHTRRLTWLVYALFIALNFTIVLGVNIAYLVIALNKSNKVLVVTQIFLALFKVVFNSACTPYLIKEISHRLLSENSAHMSEFMFVRLFVALVNNIVIPCFVVAIISPSCFYNVFVPAQTVSASFEYDGKCVVFNLQVAAFVPCLQQEVLSATTSYDPPFAYSYQCSSSFITYYAPAYVIMCIIAAFATPVLQIVAQLCHARVAVGTRMHYLLSRAVPRIMRLKDIESSTDTTSVDGSNGVTPKQRDFYHPYFDAAQHVITLLTYLGLLLTFGAVFPLLAFSFAFTMLSVAVFTRLKVGNFLLHARNANRADLIRIINEECKGVGNLDILGRSTAMILYFSCVFYALFLFDTIADTDGVDKSIWVLIVVPLLSIASNIVYILFQYIMRRNYLSSEGNSDSEMYTVGRRRLESSIEMEPAAAHRSPLHNSV